MLLLFSCDGSEAKKIIVFFLLIGKKLVGYLKQNQKLYKAQNHETNIFLKLPNYKN